MIRTEMDSMPQELDDVRRRIMQHGNRGGRAEKGGRRSSLASAWSVIQKELADMREQFNAMKARWENEKNCHRQGAEAARGNRADERRNRRSRAQL